MCKSPPNLRNTVAIQLDSENDLDLKAGNYVDEHAKMCLSSAVHVFHKGINRELLSAAC